MIPVTAPRFTLAEGPVWDGDRLLWVDIPEGRVLVGHLDGDVLIVDDEHRFDGHVGTAALAADGAMLVAETCSLTRVDPDGGRRSTGPIVEVGPDDRFNDGICDRAGRLLIGTLSLTGVHRDQRLLQIDKGTTTVLDDDLGLANGMAFSPDDSLLYSVDSVPGTVWVREYDHATGATGARRLLLDLSDTTPDGMTVDASGDLWIAIWGGAEVRRYSPEGSLVERLPVPAPHVSSVAFVGPGLDQLVVTTARSELSPAQLDAYPLSGSLFLTRTGATGLATHPWSGDLPTTRTPGAAP